MRGGLLRSHVAGEGWGGEVVQVDEGGDVLLGGGDPQVCGHMKAGSAQEREGTVLEQQDS